jgi:regulatory protein
MVDKTPRQMLLDALARREHSRGELRQKLLLKGVDEEVMDPLLDEFVRLGYQSDDRFAQSYVSMRCSRGFGPVRIREELRERVVSSDLIDAAIGTVDWMPLSQIARQKKFGLELPEAVKERTQQMRFLQYRGFTTEQIKAAVFDEYYV